MDKLVFLKLGGSLITVKTRPFTARLDKITDLAEQLSSVLSSSPDTKLLLGHGSGSFGHTAAKEFNTREGAARARNLGDYWKGFSEVWYQASALNRIVMEALYKANLRAIALPPAASVVAQNGKILAWNIAPIRAALEAGLVPVVYGDVTFDKGQGGTILSTEELMMFLALELYPQRILLAGLEDGVWEDYPSRSHLLDKITPAYLEENRSPAGGSSGTDVTGGMASKVEQMLELVTRSEGIEAQIFSGEEHGNLIKAFNNVQLGTRISRQ
ncbi:MAG: isopentenyl phosphate kinase family protein [Anaerolineales bacterium]|nr:isopentenyl phosphate kinase family protein [Anaerolineales bacterium]